MTGRRATTLDDLPKGAKTLVKQADSRGVIWKGTIVEFDGALLVTVKFRHVESGLYLAADYKDGRFVKGIAYAPWLELRAIGARDIANVLKGTLDPRLENPVPEVFRDVCAAYVIEKYDGDNY